MALLTKTDVQTLQYVQDGSPSAQIAAKSGSTPNNLDIVEDGSPFWFLEDLAASGNIKKLASVSWATVKKVAGVVEASIKKISSITN